MEKFLKSSDIALALANTPQVVFEVTDACNLSCNYCLYSDMYSAYGERYNKYLALDNAIALLNYLMGIWAKDRNLSAHKHIFLSFYGGEPLLNMPFIQSMVEFVYANLIPNGYNITFTMTTNGLLLKRNIDFLVKYNFKVMVSLDGNQYNNSYRVYKSGTESFEDLTKILDYIQNNYKDYFRKNITFNSVLHDRNDIDSAVDYINKKYNKITNVNELNNSGINENDISKFNKVYRSQGRNVRTYKASPETAKALGLASLPTKQAYHYLRKYSEMFFDDYTDLLRIEPKKFLPTATCIPFSRKIFLTVNGEILPCERISHDYILGKVYEGKIELDFQHCADVYNNLINSMTKLCIKCSNRKGCTQCGFSLSKKEHGKKCGCFMTLSQFERYENDIKQFISQNPDVFLSIINNAINI